ncbi:virulence-associated E family protein [Bacillus paranthracis]|uniref:virulence-associated E family protein n=1 Tax=Bacillus paranthracis TaxID=2026186 RepID=UPI0020B822CB|nr:virulence-associated E family protein [Bacillus paranthracis]
MLELDISFGRHRADTKWKNEFMSWEDFVEKLSRVRRTNETMAEYNKMSKADRGKIKDGAAFVGGMIREGRRKRENVDTRSLITLDVDHADDSFPFTCELVIGGAAYVIYSTHSHRPNKPKYRLVVPADRTMSQDEYAAASRKLAEQIGLDFFDKTTFDVHRLMYLPSCSYDAEPVFEVSEGEPINVDSLLDEYDDWKDPLQWARHTDDTVGRTPALKMEDPKEKGGLVGAFCRCYTISEAIAKFIPEVYEPVDGSDSRFTHVGASSHGGLVVYDNDTFAYSHHESDPVSGKEVNAFDLVRIHKFGSLDDKVSEKTNITKLPSYMAMSSVATQDNLVKRERFAELSSDFDSTDLLEFKEQEDDSWKEKLEFNSKTGTLLPTAGNVELLLSHGVWKDVLAWDAFGNSEVVLSTLPWRDRERYLRSYEPWLGADDKRLQHWFAKTFDINSAKTIQNAFTEVVHRNAFHPIKQFIESEEWDGVKRAESIFIDYLGAEDTHYVRQASRKILLAAVARLYMPGCKFDEMVVLVGAQGVGKSSLLKKLGQDWFSDSLRTFENKEAGEQLQAGWIFEIGELSAMKKSEVDEVKAFLSKTEDRYRVAYDRQVSDFPRKCVFFGTTNTKEFLRDTTGNRRFLPIEVSKERAKLSHFEHLTDELVQQIWAEVHTWLKAGESLLLDKEGRKEAVRQQEKHMESDPREGIITDWLESPIDDEWADDEAYHEVVCAAQIWTECLGNKKGTMRPYEAKSIYDILRGLPDWEEFPKRKTIDGYGKQTVFVKIEDFMQ